MESSTQQQTRYEQAIGGETWPCALVDLDAFERNARTIARLAGERRKKLRVATKSVRVPDLLRRILALAPGSGLMTYTAQETAFLHTLGFDDLLLAYPIARPADAALLARLAAAKAESSVVVDDVAHLEMLDAAARAACVTIDVVVEVDLAFRPLGSRLHLGVRRSPLRTAPDVLAFVDRIAGCTNLRFRGIMGYEAQVAGLGDDIPGGLGARVRSAAGRAMKARSQAAIAELRQSIGAALAGAGLNPHIVNGGGTGSLAWSREDPTLTEITAGSGFLCSHLFDRYRDVRLEPACYFVLPVVRIPGPGLVTCLGGGYAASGQAGVDRLPVPSLPVGLSLLDLEGAGEVQTPVRLAPGVRLRVGDPVFFRHAKAGELAEHFGEYLLVRGDEIEGRAPTYRGLGKAFLG